MYVTRRIYQSYPIMVACALKTSEALVGDDRNMQVQEIKGKRRKRNKFVDKKKQRQDSIQSLDSMICERKRHLALYLIDREAPIILIGTADQHNYNDHERASYCGCPCDTSAGSREQEQGSNLFDFCDKSGNEYERKKFFYEAAVTVRKLPVIKSFLSTKLKNANAQSCCCPLQEEWSTRRNRIKPRNLVILET